MPTNNNYDPRNANRSGTDSGRTWGGGGFGGGFGSGNSSMGGGGTTFGGGGSFGNGANSGQGWNNIDQTNAYTGRMDTMFNQGATTGINQGVMDTMGDWNFRATPGGGAVPFSGNPVSGQGLPGYSPGGVNGFGGGGGGGGQTARVPVNQMMTAPAPGGGGGGQAPNYGGGGQAPNYGGGGQAPNYGGGYGSAYSEMMQEGGNGGPMTGGLYGSSGGIPGGLPAGRSTMDNLGRGSLSTFESGGQVQPNGTMTYPGGGPRQSSTGGVDDYLDYEVANSQAGSRGTAGTEQVSTYMFPQQPQQPQQPQGNQSIFGAGGPFAQFGGGGGWTGGNNEQATQYAIQNGIAPPPSMGPNQYEQQVQSSRQASQVPGAATSNGLSGPMSPFGGGSNSPAGQGGGGGERQTINPYEGQRPQPQPPQQGTFDPGNVDREGNTPVGRDMRAVDGNYTYVTPDGRTMTVNGYTGEVNEVGGGQQGGGGYRGFEGPQQNQGGGMPGPGDRGVIGMKDGRPQYDAATSYLGADPYGPQSPGGGDKRQQPQSPYPESWGQPPQYETRDLNPNPMDPNGPPVSNTMRNWILQNQQSQGGDGGVNDGGQLGGVFAGTYQGGNNRPDMTYGQGGGFWGGRNDPETGRRVGMSEEQINQTPGEWDQQNQGGGSWGGTEPPQQGQPPWMGPNPTQPYPEGNMVPGGGQQGGGQSIEGNGDPGDGSSYRPGGVNYPGNQRGQRAPEGNMTPGGGGFNPFGQQQSQGGGSYYDPPWNAGSGQYNDPRTQEELMGRSQEQALAESGQGGGGMGGGGWSQRIPWKNGGTVNGKPGFDSRGYVPGKGLWMS